MAVVSRITTLRVDNSVTHADDTALTWVATAATQDTAAGSSVVVTITYTNGGGVTPGDAETLTLRYVTDGGTIIKTVTLNPTAASQTDTFHFTDTGNSGGAARCGTIEMKLQATRTSVVAYDFETDGSPNSPPAGFHAHTLDQGWIRGTTTRAEAVSNVSLGGALTEPAEYDESLFVRLTEGAVSYVARALTVASSAGSLSSATNSTTAVQRDVTFTNVVDERFAAAVTNVTWSVTVPNAALTGSPDWAATTTTEAALNVDPRLTCTHHFQVDNNTFALASNDTTKQMLSTQSGFLWTIIKAARGTGVNGVTVQQTLDPDNPGTTVTDTATATTTQGGQDGVSGRLDWTASKPGGSWQKSVDITAPADIDGATYLLSSTDTLTMLNVDPRFRTIISLCPTATGTEGRHVEAGDNVTARAAFYNGATFKRLAPDAGTVKLLMARFNIALGRFEYLASDGTTWTHWSGTTTTADTVTMTDAGDGATFTYNFTSTSGWTSADIVAIAVTANIGGTPYSFYVPRELVGTNNRHDTSTGAAPYGGARRRDVERVAKRLKELEERTETFTREITEKETLVVERMSEAEGRQYAALASEQAAIRKEIELLTALVLANA